MFSLSRLASTEGLIQLTARGLGSIFQFMYLKDLMSEESDASAQTIGKGFGKLAGAVIDFKI